VSVLLVACSHAPTSPVIARAAPSPPDAGIPDARRSVPDATRPDAESPDAGEGPYDPSVWRLPRRTLPASPTLADVICDDAERGLRLDAVRDPDGPSATFTSDYKHVRICVKKSCHEVPAVGESPVTDGKYLVAFNDDVSTVYRASDGKRLYDLKPPSDRKPDDYFVSGGVLGFMDGTLLAAGWGSGGPLSQPWLLDAATGRPIAELVSKPMEVLRPRALQLGGHRFAIVADNCTGGWIIDARDGSVSESLTCDPSPSRVVGRKKIPFTPVPCP
jgi:hypothetical protein